MEATTNPTSGKNLREGDRFHVAGRNGMGELEHRAVAIERIPRTIIVTTEDREIRLSANSKVWVVA